MLCSLAMTIFQGHRDDWQGFSRVFLLLII
ncbi:hypothetical protein E2C01_017163 [Portunus trituberculatus]|uniref:Uncharacterized protein n=1 Tax=Portunus trituberculatus TaxID=210409 RepID=A0A5B7DQV4_PORTR|nr:hypothetical protein [Portunus trituberculatus]